MINVNFLNAYKSLSFEEHGLNQLRDHHFDKMVFEYLTVEFNSSGFIKRSKFTFFIVLNKETELWSIGFSTDKQGYLVTHYFGDLPYLEARAKLIKSSITNLPPVDAVYRSVGRSYLNGELVHEKSLTGSGTIAINFEKGVFDTPDGPSAFYLLVPEHHPFAEGKYKILLLTNGGVAQDNPELPSTPRVLMNSLSFKDFCGTPIEMCDPETKRDQEISRNSFSSIVGGGLSLSTMKGYFDGWFFESIYHVKNAGKLASDLGIEGRPGEEITAVIGVQFEVIKPYFQTTLDGIDEELDKHFQLYGEPYIEFTIKGFATSGDDVLPQSDHRTIRFSKGAIKVENFGFSIR